MPSMYIHEIKLFQKCLTDERVKSPLRLRMEIKYVAKVYRNHVFNISCSLLTITKCVELDSAEHS